MTNWTSMLSNRTREIFCGAALALAFGTAADTAHAQSARVRVAAGGVRFTSEVAPQRHRGFERNRVVRGSTNIRTGRSRFGGRRAANTGRFEIRRERVWVAGRVERVWVPPVFEWRVPRCGPRQRICVQPGYYKNVQQPGYYSWETQRVWVPATRGRVVRRFDRSCRGGRF